MAEIRLWNTRTRAKEPLVPLDPENLRMYVCGPTVYDRAHIGNARPVVVFDVLYRLLRHEYGPDHVTYVRNFTDVDDKINARATEMKGRGDTRPLVEIIRELTDGTIAWYHEDMDALGALRPTHEPRATDYIGQMVAMIAVLVEKGHAYAAEGHVLFDVKSYGDYGKLARRSLDDMRAGARVEVAPYKRDPMDFVLWKPSTDEEPGWDSPWGRGRPGWHIECSAMAHELLGESFDIHGGGIDLAFPHHENEVAQSACAHPEGDFAKIWMHNGFVQVEGEKMSKSLGNFFTVKDLLLEYDSKFSIENIGPAIRLRLLEGHYRSPIDAGRSFIEAAATKLGTWWFWVSYYQPLKIDATEREKLLSDSRVVRALADDLNTPAAIAIIDDLIGKLKRIPENASDIGPFADNQEKIAKCAVAAIEFLGFNLNELKALHHSSWSENLKKRNLMKEANLDSLISGLLERRNRARAERDFAKADAIRDTLTEAGVIVKDTSGGAEWELSQNFDATKLEVLK